MELNTLGGAAMWDDDEFTDELEAEMAENMGIEFLDGPSVG